ncbi:MAG TPA: citryl-CoA lyase [Kofleriaceae bacterium]|nr:citryl-CoA lyase [Kofleriaceae bacterium]
MERPPKKSTRICGATEDRIEVRGKDLVDELMGQISFTEMFLFQLLGAAPSAMQVNIADAVLVAIMEHGLVPSVLASRFTLLGAPESYQGAVAAGLLGVGDRFAGTASECALLLDRVARAPAAERQQAALGEVEAHRRERRPLPGFGHPTHKAADPRVARLFAIARAAGAGGEFIAAVHLLEQAMLQVVGRPVPANVSSAIAAALLEAGLPAEVMRGVVLVARCAGLVGHLHEESSRPMAQDMWKLVEREFPYEPETEP